MPNTRTFVLLVVLLSVFVGALNVTPHVLFSRALAEKGLTYDPYSGVRFFDMTAYIGARMKDVSDGYIFPSDTDIYEYKKGPHFWPPFSALIYYPFFLIFDSITKVVIVTDFIFPAVLYALLCYLLYLLTGGKIYFSALFSLCIALYVNFSIQIPPPNLQIFKAVIDTINPFTETPIAHLLTRRESFIPGLLPVFAMLIFLVQTIKKQSLVYPILGGFFYALIVYTYPFHGLYFGIGLVFLFLFALIAREKVLIKRLFLFGLAGGLFLVPYIANQVSFHELRQYDDIFARFGIEEGRSFRFDHFKRYLWSGVVGAVLIYLGRRYSAGKEVLVPLSLLISGIIVLNVQLFWGYNIQSDHWVTRDLLWGFHLSYALIAFYGYRLFVEKREIIANGLLIITIILISSVTFNAFRSHVSAARSDFSVRTIPQYYREAFDWLNKNTPKDSVVGTPSLVTNHFIPLYTHDNIFIPRVYNTLAPEEEAIQRLFIIYNLFSVTPLYLEDSLHENSFITADTLKEGYMSIEANLVNYLFGVKYIRRDLDAYTSGEKIRFYIPDEKREEILGNYKKFNCVDCLNAYKIDYVIYGPQEKEFSSLKKIIVGEWDNVYTSNDVSIYKRKPIN